MYDNTILIDYNINASSINAYKDIILNGNSQ